MVEDIPKITPDANETPEELHHAPNPPALSETGEAAVARAEAALSGAEAKIQGGGSVSQQPSIQPQPNSTPPTLETSITKPKKRFPKWLKILLIILGFWIVIGILIAIPALKTLKAAKTTLTLAKETYAAGKNQNLPEFNAKLEATKKELDNTYKLYKILIWTKIIPFVGGYYSDGDHGFKAGIAGIEAAQILGKTLEPYADVLGFTGAGTFTGGTAEDRITKIVETLDKVVPEIDKVKDKIAIADEELSKINSHRYAFTIKGRNLKESITAAQAFAKDAHLAVTDAKPILEVLPQVLGAKSERKYLVIFQNDAEIRPTGGFMTAYGVMRVDKGKVYQVKSDDIYHLDAKFTKKIKPPEIIQKYLPLVFYWYLRDMNLSPDYKESMDTFHSYYKDVPGEEKVDGIISMDTQVLNDLVKVLGPIDVPGYGQFTSETDPECNCPQVIYQLELIADKPLATLKQDRKGVIAPLLQTILLKAYGSPKNMWPGLFETGIRNINEKHVLFYMMDNQEQLAVEGVNIGGRIREYDGDYFHVNDANLGGAKSNMYIDEEVAQEVTINDDGTLTKKVTLTYKNTQPGSNCNLEAGELCLNGVMRDVIRLYVPKGSQLKEALGFEDAVETKEDLGKTVFQGFFELRPQNQGKLVFEYTVPIKIDKEYKLLIQKQPGKKKPKYTVTVNQEHQEEFDLSSDRELKIKL